MPIAWYAMFTHADSEDPDAASSQVWLPVVGWDLGADPVGYVVSPTGHLHRADSDRLKQDLYSARFHGYEQIDDNHRRWFLTSPTPAPAPDTELLVELSTGRRFTARREADPAAPEAHGIQLMTFTVTENGQRQILQVHPDAIVSIAVAAGEQQPPAG